jgi:hypothetical protein
MSIVLGIDNNFFFLAFLRTHLMICAREVIKNNSKYFNLNFIYSALIMALIIVSCVLITLGEAYWYIIKKLFS